MRYHCIVVLSVIATDLRASLAEPLSPPWDNMHIKHSWNAVPTNWVSLGRPPSGTTIDLYIALKPNHEDALTDALYEVSEPGNPRYRAHLTKEQVADLVAPRPETLELVNSWLEHHNISSISMTHAGSTLKLKGVSVTQANTLLGASYQVYRHVERGETIVRTVGYSLPRALHLHVLTVVPTTSFVSPRTQWQTPRNDSSGETVGLAKSASGEPVTMLSGRAKVDYVTPSFLRWLYDTEAYRPNAMDRNVLGIVGLLGDTPSPADMEAFMRKYRDAVDATYYKVVKINGGGYDPTRPHEEANLDIQYAEAMAYPTPHIFYSLGRGPSRNDWLVTWLEYILDQRDIPQTISISYTYEERWTSREHAFHVCNMFAMLGSLGVSVLVASGNDGIGRGTCVNRDGRVRFIPTFPATCPWVTVVGGTTDYEPEVAARFSGGGFSDHFERPLYQRRSVPTFLEDLGSRYQGLYNDSGRGIPDIAAQSMNLPIFFKGQEQREFGTSGATPIVAGIISLLNDWLISTGRYPLGFLNPWLYGKGLAALDDITQGSNPGCGMDGFSAIAGWDPVRFTRLNTCSLSMLDDPGLIRRSRVSERLSFAE
ncbi:subtilisin-like protein [Lactarius akahatsu]|uniref:Subtilisin-like protein n=1 Tax=Lactarius akahatsu TaxID=416441 RepID=A0AAD4LBK1_9AGAM|nr:subtilisin-like protein [Lactarius akahatsu]